MEFFSMCFMIYIFIITIIHGDLKRKKSHIYLKASFLNL